LAAICDKAMALEPGDRFDCAHDFQEALEDYLDRSPYRVGPKEVGGTVTAAFVEERPKIRALIEEQMRRRRDASDDEPVSIVDMQSGMPAAMEPTPTLTPHPASAGTLVASQMSQPPVAMPPPKSRGTLYALVGLAIIGASVVGFFALSRPSRTSASTADAAASKPTSPAIVAQGDQIQVRIAYPKGATAKLDGETLHDNPFLKSLPRDLGMHKIDVSGDSLKAVQRTVTFDKDVDLTIAEEAPADPSTAVAGTPHVGGWSRPTPKATASAVVDAPPVKPPPVDTDELHQRPPPKKPIDIDETDPYHKKP
jgi:hypothetical protein